MTTAAVLRSLVEYCICLLLVAGLWVAVAVVVAFLITSIRFGITLADSMSGKNKRE